MSASNPEALAIMHTIEKMRKAAKEPPKTPPTDPTKLKLGPKEPEKGLKLGGDKTPPKK